MRRSFVIALILCIPIIFAVVLLYGYNNTKQPRIAIGDTFSPYSSTMDDDGNHYTFHVFFAEKNKSYSLDSYIPFDDIIRQIGGTTRIFDINESDQYKKKKSVVIITDADHVIVGIYPNTTPNDFIRILELHPDLADFNLIKTAF